ncbi:methylenetetrahydrofolate reductase C-terminal domain-containing protein [Microbacterium hominis]|uniref:Methylenetetrahydrofolate reductase n=1 Tax=Microbacterium hominis TaxID=162426 RepID=A0A2K9DT51_9MICO|nr:MULTISPECIES: methylenetetrahydrofolate reductase C-terminal domain-containing protein [Microbacterium]AUG29044.1 methylenetetrahydrofolate reductase [Microbacterium hominis]QRY40501.1 methylenetetrahydrofolate reductase C-terminal domain-containing protein [Microbacterium hominis]
MTVQLRLRDASRRCPKRMVYGPCGGVGADGGCEVPGIRCSFAADPDLLHTLDVSAADVAAPESAEPSGDALPLSPRRTAAAAFATRVSEGLLVTADLPVRSADAGVLAEAGARLAGLTAVIAGEPPGLRASLSPTHKALVLGGAGATVIAGITCRDRNRVAIEGELAALADLGVAGVLAVTGDHPASTALPHAQPVFDLDSTRVAALARRAGLFVAVAEQPAAPPIDYRPVRLALKARAGAELAILNLCGDLSDLVRFAGALAATGAAIPLVASVPVITSRSAALRLAALPGVRLPSGLVTAVTAAAAVDDAGVHAAVAAAREALTVPGVVGVHLSAVVDEADPTGLAAVDAIVRTATLLRAGRAPSSDATATGAAA